MKRRGSEIVSSWPNTWLSNLCLFEQKGGLKVANPVGDQEIGIASLSKADPIEIDEAGGA